MAGPTMMALGPFAFQAMGFSLTDSSTKMETPWATVPVVGGVDRLQWVGPKGATQTISGVLFSEHGGQSSLEGIKLAARNGIAMPLVSVGGFPFNVFGLWAVESVTEDKGFFDGGGRAQRNAYQISIREKPIDLTIGGAMGELLSLVF